MTNRLRAFWWALRVAFLDVGKCRGACNQGRRQCDCMKWK
jgi:hypothetical protein